MFDKFGTLIGLLNLDGNQAASAEQQFLGYVQGDTVFDAQENEVGTIDRGVGSIHNSFGNTLLTLNAKGDATGNTECYLGKFHGFSFTEIDLIALYSIFIDKQFTDETTD